MVAFETSCYRYSEIYLQDLLKLIETYNLDNQKETLYRYKGKYVDVTPELLTELSKEYTFIYKKCTLRRSRIADIVLTKKGDEEKMLDINFKEYMFICLFKDSYSLVAWRSLHNKAYKNFKKYNRGM